MVSKINENFVFLGYYASWWKMRRVGLDYELFKKLSKIKELSDSRRE
jgi:hypothetical protein